MRVHRRDPRRAAAVIAASAFTLSTLGAPARAAGQAASPPEKGSILSISHDQLPCVVTELAPQVDAQVAPGPQLDRGYVYFKAAGTEDFYYTAMKGPAENLQGVLPRPLPETKAIDYKVRARDLQALNKETPEYTPPVVPGNACKTKGLLVGKNGAGLTIGLTQEGQNPVPPGFNKRDIAFVILLSGATVTLASALAGGSASGSSTAAAAGGGSKGALIAGGVVVAAGAALVIANNTGGGSSRTATPRPTTTPTPTSTPTPTAPLQFVEADATWSGLGDVDVQILNANGQAVGYTLASGCESTAQRSERVLLQGAPSGSYRVMLSGKTCGPETPASIAVVTSVQSSSQPKCPNQFLNVPVGGTITACSFTLP